MKQAMVVIGHPRPGSLAHAAADRIVTTLEKSGITAILVDLYADQFDPRLPGDDIERRFSFDPLVQRYIALIENSDTICVVHPEWWELPPAIVKGWVDRVLLPGVAYEYEGEEFLEKHRVPLLTEQRGLFVSTTDAKREDSERLTERFWRTAVARFCGINTVEVSTCYRVRESTYRDRESWLASLEATVQAWS